MLIPINIVLEINSSSSADRRENTSELENISEFLPIKVTFHFKIRWLATLKFKDVLTENKKGNIYVAVEKQQEKERLKETERQINRQVGVIRELKTGRSVLTD